MSGPGPSLAVEHLHVRYVGRSTEALADVTLRVDPGTMVGIAGRTGAGKSSLVLAAAGFVPRVVRASVEGSVVVAGVEALHGSASQLAGRVGVVFSTPAHQLSSSKLTVREELAFGLENLGVDRRDMDPRIDATLDRLGILDLGARDPLSLSGGEQQRVAIASILVMGSRVLVLDEPVAQLDPAGSERVAALLEEVARDGACVLVAEHASSVLGRADRLAVLDGGRIVVTDLPGIALSSEHLSPLGATPPTIVRLAEVAGIPASSAFDEVAVAQGLASVLRAGHGWSSRDLRDREGTEATGVRSGSVELPAMRRHVPVIEVVDLVHRYPGAPRAAVDGVSLRIVPGQTVAIVGQNGSGKSTLVKHLNGLMRPLSGAVRLDGQDIAGMPVHELARDVGFVFQDPDDQLFERSVEREVAFGPRHLGIPGSEVGERVARALALVGLDQERGTNPYDLGPSLRKLVALASVLASAPGVLVLDEPTGGQDAPGIARIAGVVRDLSWAGRTVVAITHDMEFAASVAHRVVVLRAGRVIADGPPTSVLAASSAGLLATTGLTPPVAARIAARLGLDGAPADAEQLLHLASMSVIRTPAALDMAPGDGHR